MKILALTEIGECWPLLDLAEEQGHQIYAFVLFQDRTNRRGNVRSSWRPLIEDVDVVLVDGWVPGFQAVDMFHTPVIGGADELRHGLFDALYRKGIPTMPGASGKDYVLIVSKDSDILLVNQRGKVTMRSARIQDELLAPLVSTFQGSEFVGCLPIRFAQRYGKIFWGAVGRNPGYDTLALMLRDSGESVEAVFKGLLEGVSLPEPVKRKKIFGVL